MPSYGEGGVIYNITPGRNLEVKKKFSFQPLKDFLEYLSYI